MKFILSIWYSRKEAYLRTYPADAIIENDYYNHEEHSLHEISYNFAKFLWLRSAVFLVGDTVPRDIDGFNYLQTNPTAWQGFKVVGKRKTS